MNLNAKYVIPRLAAIRYGRDCMLRRWEKSDLSLRVRMEECGKRDTLL